MNDRRRPRGRGGRRLCGLPCVPHRRLQITGTRCRGRREREESARDRGGGGRRESSLHAIPARPHVRRWWLSCRTVGWDFRSSAQHREAVAIHSRRPGGWLQGPLDSVGYGELAFRVAEFSFHEHDEGTAEEVAREPDYRERDYEERGADNRCQDDCDDCQRHEDRAAEEEFDNDDDDTDDDVRDEQDAAANDDRVDDPRRADDDVEDGSCARPGCRRPRKFLVPRAVEDLVAEATVVRLLDR